MPGPGDYRLPSEFGYYDQKSTITSVHNWTITYLFIMEFEFVPFAHDYYIITLPDRAK